MMKLENLLLGAAAFLLVSCGSDMKYDATGAFEATEVLISAEGNGRLMQFCADEGMVVKAGQEVGIIDTVQLYLKKLQLAATRKSVDSQKPDMNKQVAALQQQLNTAVRERNRVMNLLKEDAANRKQLDDWEAQITLLEKQIDAQRSTLDNSLGSLTEQSSSVSIQIAQIEDQLQKCHVVSPITGTVLAKYAEAGELMAVGKPLFKVADLDKVYIRAYITSAQLEKVKLGQKAKVYADYGDGIHKEYEGTVTWISETSEFTPKTILTEDERADMVYAIKVSVKNDGSIKIGMYGGVCF